MFKKFQSLKFLTLGAIEEVGGDFSVGGLRKELRRYVNAVEKLDRVAGAMEEVDWAGRVDTSSDAAAERCGRADVAPGPSGVDTSSDATGDEPGVAVVPAAPSKTKAVEPSISNVGAPKPVLEKLDAGRGTAEESSTSSGARDDGAGAGRRGLAGTGRGAGQQEELLGAALFEAKIATLNLVGRFCGLFGWSRGLTTDLELMGKVAAAWEKSGGTGTTNVSRVEEDVSSLQQVLIRIFCQCQKIQKFGPALRINCGDCFGRGNAVSGCVCDEQPT